jgi:hypothetical protein
LKDPRHGPVADASRTHIPPVAGVAVVALALVVVGGIIMASYIPRRPPLGIPIALLTASGLLMAANAVMLARLRSFAWGTFFLVGRWALAAYLVSAGMIEFAFVHDHARGGPLVVVTLMLVVFAVDVPLIIGFTVARY